MAKYEPADIRNVALVGHGGAGKTLLVDALLVAAGTIEAMGSIERANTVCDFDPQEKEHKHSLYSAVVSLEHDHKQINIIDTPGYPDFWGQSLSVLSAVDAVIVVIDAHAGIQLTTHKMMEIAAAHSLARILVVNRIDHEDVDFAGLMEQITAAFGEKCLPLNLPAGGGTGVADCFFKPGKAATDFSAVDEAHTRITDRVVEVDEDLMERYLEQGEELNADMLHDAFGQALREGHLVPICFTSAQTGTGVAELLNVIAQVIPSPDKSNPPALVHRQQHRSEPVILSEEVDAPVIAHVFKVTVDAFVGRMGVFRIHQGTVTKESQLYINDSRKPFKVGHLLKLQGKEHIEIERGVRGDLCAIAKVNDLEYNAVLHEAVDDADISLTAITLPQPMYGLAIHTANRGDEQKLSDALQKLTAEDTCFTVEHNAALNETVIKSLGELHMRMLLDRLNERYNIAVDTRPPRIEYRETVCVAADGHYRHKKQSGGAGQFGEVFLSVEPTERGSGFEFVSKVVGGVIPGQFIPAVEKGVRQVLVEGAIAGYPLQDVRVTIYDGKHHPVDSKEVAFATAGKRAFMDAINKARPIVLEPIVNIAITAPQDYMGDIVGGLSSKRGRISGTEAIAGGAILIVGQVPLSELGSYPIELKSITGGTGSYTMEPDHYDAVPAQIQQQLVTEYNPAAEDE